MKSSCPTPKEPDAPIGPVIPSDDRATSALALAAANKQPPCPPARSLRGDNRAPKPKRRVIWVLTSRGGSGKTTMVKQIHAALELASEDVLVIQVDNQSHLANVLRANVVSVMPATLDAATADPNGFVEAFLPMGNVLDQAKKSGTHVLVDVGAGHLGPTMEIAELADLNARAEREGVQNLVFVLATREVESLNQAITAINRAKQAFRSGRIVLVLNERDGSFDKKLLTTAAVEALEQATAAVPTSSDILRMPKCRGNALQRLDALSITPLSALKLSPDELAEKLGLPTMLADIAAGDLAAFLGTMQQELSKFLNDGDAQ